MSSEAFISVITVVYNAVGTIRNSIESAIGQKERPEYIIIDGGSTDGTMDIIHEYEKEINTLISEPDDGMYHALNKGFSLAKGEVIGVLHADDVFATDQIVGRVRSVFKANDVDACYGDLVYVDGVDTEKVFRYWQSGEFRKEKFLWGWMPPHPTFFIKRKCVETYGGFRLGLGSAADYEFMLRLLFRYGITAAYIPEVLTKMRVGGMSNTSLKIRVQANLMDRKAWQINGIRPYPWTLFLKPLIKLGQFVSRP